MKWKRTDVAFKKANASLCIIIQLNVLLSWQSNKLFRRWQQLHWKTSNCQMKCCCRTAKGKIREWYEVSAKMWETSSFNFTTARGCTEPVCVYLTCHLYESGAGRFSEHIRAHPRVISFHLDCLWAASTNKTNRNTNLRHKPPQHSQTTQCSVLINSAAFRGKVW